MTRKSCAVGMRSAILRNYRKRLNGNGVTHYAAELPNVLNDFFSTVGQKLAANVPEANFQHKEYLAKVNLASSFFFEPVIPSDTE